MYTLPESITIQNVKPVQDELLAFLNLRLEKPGQEKGEAALNFIHLKDLDTAGLQLLLSAAISFHQNNHPLKIINVAAPIRELLLLTGALDILTPA